MICEAVLPEYHSFSQPAYCYGPARDRVIENRLWLSCSHPAHFFQQLQWKARYLYIKCSLNNVKLQANVKAIIQEKIRQLTHKYLFNTMNF